MGFLPGFRGVNARSSQALYATDKALIAPASHVQGYIVTPAFFSPPQPLFPLPVPLSQPLLALPSPFSLELHAGGGGQ